MHNIAAGANLERDADSSVKKRRHQTTGSSSLLQYQQRDMDLKEPDSFLQYKSRMKTKPPNKPQEEKLHLVGFRTNS
jgi:hypothetical protein